MKAALMFIVLLSAHRAFAQECAVDVPIAGSLQASGKGRYTGTPVDIPLVTGAPGAVSGTVRVVFQAVAGSCDFASVASTKSNAAAFAASLAAAKLQTVTPLAVAQMAGGYPFQRTPDAAQNAYKLRWTVDGLQLALASDAIGGRLNQVKRVASLRAAVPAGAAALTLEVGASACPPSGFAGGLSAPLAGAAAAVVAPVTAGCSLQVSKAGGALTLDCSKLKVDLGTVGVLANQEGGAAACGGATAGEQPRMSLRLEVPKGGRLGGGASLADARPLAS